MQQQQQQQQGGSQYGVSPPEMAPQFASPVAGPHMLGIPDHHPPPEAASPISSRPPAPRLSFDQVPPSALGGFPDDDALAAGEDAERGGASGNRWPKQETLALLKIRSEMDATFRDATLKGPLWDEVSRKLAELGYTRSAKKCKEKFENVHKYYKRTKEGRAGRQDGKSYRFFTQLEALHGGISISTIGGMPSPTAIPAIPTTTLPALTAPPIAMSTMTSTMAAPAPAPAPAPVRVHHTIPSVPVPVPVPVPFPAPTFTTPTTTVLVQPASIAGISLSSDTFSSSSFDSDDEDEHEGGSKRKRGGSSSGGGSSRKMMSFFEGLMKQVMEKQETMQQQFLDTIEKREQDRMIREEAWKRQEMARLNHEHDLLAKERAVAASRDAAVISFLQKISSQVVQLPPPHVLSVPVLATTSTTPSQPTPPPPRPPATPTAAPQQSPQTPQHAIIPPQQQAMQKPPPSPQAPSQQEMMIIIPPIQQQQQQQQQLKTEEMVVVLQQKLPPTLPPSSASSTAALVPAPVDAHDVVGVSGTFEATGLGVSPSRWPKSEVHALIKLRSGLESRYQEAGPKGPLWEEISSGMRQMGYNRSAKRCKEKWENINKYFKKVKESNKRRPEDAKTCPYFHQLDALYRKKAAVNGLLFANHRQPLTIQDRPIPTTVLAAADQQQQQQQRSGSGSDVVQLITAEPPTGHPQNPQDTDNKSSNHTTSVSAGNMIQIQTSKGGFPPSFFQEGPSGGIGGGGGGGGGATNSNNTMNKPEDIMKELMERRHQQQQESSLYEYDKLDEPDSDNNLDDEDDDDEDEEEEEKKMQYKIQFQNVGGGPGGGGGGGNNPSAKAAAAATSNGSFLAMVK